MSSQGMLWARAQKTGNPTTKSLLLLIGELVNDEGTTTRSQIYMAEILELHPKSVARSLKALEDAGYIRRERRPRGTERRATNRTILNIGPIETRFVTEEEDLDSVGNGGLPTEDGPDLVGNPELPMVGNRGLPIVGNPRLPIKDKQLNSQEETLLGCEPLFEAEGSTAVAVREKNLKQEANIIAKRATEASNGSLPFMGMRGIADHFLHQGFSTDQVLTAMGNLWKNGRSVNRQSVGQVLQGIIRPDGSRPRKSTAQRNLEAGIRAIEILKAEEEAQEAGR